MHNLTLVAAIDRNLAIGYKGDLLVRIKADLQHFKELTLGERIIYGKNTLFTFPKAQVLPGRENVILAADDFTLASSKETVTHICHSLNELASYLDSLSDSKLNFCIGGASVYRQLIPYASTLELTEIDYAYPNADVYFPEFRQDFQLQEASEYMLDELAQVKYRYARYVRT